MKYPEVKVNINGLSLSTLGISVVDWSQGMEPLLSRGVPDGEVHRSLSNLQLLVHEGGLKHNLTIPGKQSGKSQSIFTRSQLKAPPLPPSLSKCIKISSPPWCVGDRDEYTPVKSSSGRC